MKLTKIIENLSFDDEDLVLDADNPSDSIIPTGFKEPNTNNSLNAANWDESLRMDYVDEMNYYILNIPKDDKVLGQFVDNLLKNEDPNVDFYFRTIANEINKNHEPTLNKMRFYLAVLVKKDKHSGLFLNEKLNLYYKSFPILLHVHYRDMTIENVHYRDMTIENINKLSKLYFDMDKYFYKLRDINNIIGAPYDISKFITTILEYFFKNNIEFSPEFLSREPTETQKEYISYGSNQTEPTEFVKAYIENVQYNKILNPKNLKGINFWKFIIEKYGYDTNNTIESLNKILIENPQPVVEDTSVNGHINQILIRTKIVELFYGKLKIKCPEIVREIIEFIIRGKQLYIDNLLKINANVLVDYINDIIGGKLRGLTNVDIKILTIFKHRFDEVVNSDENYHHFDVFPLIPYNDAIGTENYAVRHINDTNLARILEKWTELTPEDKKKSPSNIIKKYPEIFGSNKEDKEDLFKKYNQTEFIPRFEKSKDTNSFFSNIKKIWKHGNYKAYFVRRDDQRGLMMGMLLGMCQHPKGVGEGCAWMGQEQPNSGFLLVQEDKNLVAGSLCWTNGNTMCFDSAEIPHSYRDKSEEIYKIYELVVKDLSKLFSQINIGYGVHTFRFKELQDNSEDKIDLPNNHGGYNYNESDVKIQRVFHKSESMNFYVFTRQDMLNNFGMEKIHQYFDTCYDTRAFNNLGDYNLVMLENNEIIAMCAIKNAYIEDLSIRPDKRKLSSEFLNKILTYLKLTKKQWSAHCVQNTSYKLLKYLEKKEVIKIDQENPTDMIINNTPVIDVKFTMIKESLIRRIARLI